MIKMYIAKETYNVKVNELSFDVVKGSSVTIAEVDSTYNQVLVDYGAGVMGWMNAASFHNLFNEKVN